jgi:hypothetical protein
MAKITAHTANSLRFNRIAVAFILVLAALSQGCYSSSDGSSLRGNIGFASDTTAIFLYELWEASIGGIPKRSSTEYYGLELRLVDVRFNKVYWKAQINHSRSNTSQRLRTAQWNDSTMLIELKGEGYWLWTVGNKTPQKVSFKWNPEMKDYETGELLYDFRLRPWKNGSILLFSKARQVTIDFKTMVINDWLQTSENIWLSTCDDFWWGKKGGVCLKNKPYGFTLLSEKGDTLSSFTYAHECINSLPGYGKKCDISSSFSHNFIEVSLGKCSVSDIRNICENCPSNNIICAADNMYIRYDDKWNVNREPSFWDLYLGEGKLRFLDLLGNIAEY